MNSFPVLPGVSIARQWGALNAPFKLNPYPPMQSATYPLDQSSLLLLSGLIAAGHEESAESCEPLPSPPPFDYAAVRDRISGYAPPAPRSYVSSYEQEETPDISEDEDEESTENALRSFARDKQGRESSPWLLPSARSRRDVMSEYASMGISMID